MKKKLLFSILCLGLLLPIGANADDSTNIDSIEEENNSANVDATVSNVAVPTYDVYITWADLTFDWVYNKDTKSFEWKPTKECVPATIYDQESYNQYEGEVYTDETCSVLDEEGYNEEKEYYKLRERENAFIGIEDLSENGEIVPSITWASETKYSDTEAEIKYSGLKCVAINSKNVFDIALSNGIYSNEDCTTKVPNTPEYEIGKYYAYIYNDDEDYVLTTEEIPNNGRISSGGNCVDKVCLPHETPNQYSVFLKLKGGTVTPTVGDKIGSVTIKIKVAK